MGTDQTVARMADVIEQSVATPIVRQAATYLVGNLRPSDFLGQIYAIREWCAQHIVFLRDPSGKELLHTPEWMLNRIDQDGAAHVDCDDAAILAGALCGSVGLRVALVTVAFLDKSQPMSHIWASATGPVQMLDSDKRQIWIELDVTRPMQSMPADAISRCKVYPVLV